MQTIPEPVVNIQMIVLSLIVVLGVATFFLAWCFASFLRELVAAKRLRSKPGLVRREVTAGLWLPKKLPASDSDATVKKAAAIIAAVVILSASLSAQEKWKIDTDYSVMVLSLGLEPNLLNMGLALVTGEVVVDPFKCITAINFKTTPRRESQLRYAEIKFTSKQCTSANGQRWLVAGTLSVKRVERRLTPDPNVDYAGQHYAVPVSRSERHEVTFVFPALPEPASKNKVMHLTGKATLKRNAFPELIDTIALDDWPIQLLQGENSAGPAMIGEDYRRLGSTGTVIVIVSNPLVPAGANDNWVALRPSVFPDRDAATLTLDLRIKK